ncbi:glutamate receptor ionotropic, delta-1-like [Culicoides brevitarsis]|uniref:glutamate receptor ionotropic, delta-1-like n=1 Tax=Culicoides brevitarsis TaxID=469753 RepID=UPI00307B4969
MTFSCLNVIFKSNALNVLKSRYAPKSLAFAKRSCFTTHEKDKATIPDLNVLRKELSGKVLKVTALEEYPFTYFELDEDGKLQGRGAAFKLFDILAAKYNFTYEIVQPTNNFFGSIKQKNGTILELFTKGKVDMGIGYIPPMHDYRVRALYSTQINVATYHIMMVKPRGSIISKGLLAPFRGIVWIVTGVFFVIMGPLIYYVLKFHQKFTKKEKIKTLDQVFWFIYGALVRQGHGTHIYPINDSTKILFATWWTFVTILTTVYTANLVAFLARSEFPFSISTIEDFVGTNTKLLVKKGGSVEYALMTDRTLAPLRKTIDVNAPFFGGSPNETEAMMETLLKKNYAIIASYTGAKHLMYDYYMSKRVSAKEFNSREHCPFILSKKPIFWGIQSFVYKCSSQLNFLFDKDLRFLLESGVAKYLKQSDLPNKNVCDLSKQKVETQLKVQDLEISFIIVFIGFLVSLAALIGEFYYMKRQIAKQISSAAISKLSSRMSVVNEILEEILHQKREFQSI